MKQKYRSQACLPEHRSTRSQAGGRTLGATLLNLFELKNTLVLLAITLSLFIVISSCKKDDAQQNPVTTSQSSAFSAYLNGVIYNADTAYCIIHVDSSMWLRSFVMNGVRSSEFLSIAYLDTILIEYIDVNSPIGWGGAILDYEDTLTTTTYLHESINLIFTSMDTVKNIISGTFNGKIVNSSNLDTIQVTNGAFNNIEYEFEHSN